MSETGATGAQLRAARVRREERVGRVEPIADLIIAARDLIPSGHRVIGPEQIEAVKALYHGYLEGRWQFLQAAVARREAQRSKPLTAVQIDEIVEKALVRWWALTNTTPDTLKAVAALIGEDQ